MFFLPGKSDLVWAKAGHEVAWDQLELTSWNIPAPETFNAQRSKFNVHEDDQQITISGSGFGYVISKQTGNLEQIEVGGKQVLKSPVEFNLWRAPIANGLQQKSYLFGTCHGDGHQFTKDEMFGISGLE